MLSRFDSAIKQRLVTPHVKVFACFGKLYLNRQLLVFSPSVQTDMDS
jgi:hypothetical protein